MGAVEFSEAGCQGEGAHQGAEVFGGFYEKRDDQVELLGFRPIHFAGYSNLVPFQHAGRFLEAEVQIFGQDPLGLVHIEGIWVREAFQILILHRGQSGDRREGGRYLLALERFEAVEPVFKQGFLLEFLCSGFHSFSVVRCQFRQCGHL